ncbi:MAG: hypothetical protein COA79_04065 [Planctomycetota bacterium]|nr:MAG: hypothetical protein COA79_04065 [Planctomycetota bacterium]
MEKSTKLASTFSNDSALNSFKFPFIFLYSGLWFFISAPLASLKCQMPMNFPIFFFLRLVS